MSACRLLAQAAQATDPEAGEFNLFLFGLLLIACVALFALVVVGVIIGLAVAVAVIVAIFSGAAISSLLLGFSQRSAKAGFTALIVQLTAAGGAILGASAGALYSHFNGLPLLNFAYTGSLFIGGAAGGALGGWMVARVWIWIATRFQAWFQNWNRPGTPAASLPATGEPAIRET